MASPGQRNLVICCDGTNNEIGKLLSNVLKLYRIAEKSDRQVVYYQPGIGTISMPDAWGQWLLSARSLFEMATGRGLDRDVIGAYCFLARHYRPGDNIYLFGFSRGAYTARVVAGMIYLVGLLREDQINLAGYALKAYKQSRAADGHQLARDFIDTVRPNRVPIRFLGVWDTVSSVIVPGRLPWSSLRLEALPHTSSNPAVQTFRHAAAIDEFRRMFRLTRWDEGQFYRPNPFSKAESFPLQDSRQVWFAGCHSDVGGGFLEEQSALSKFPLLWMLEQARENGLLLRTEMINHMVRGAERKGARSYTKPDPNGQMHNAMTIGWMPLELFPKSVRYREWLKRPAFRGRYLPMAEPRFIPERSRIHTSVIERKRQNGAYRPVNLPQHFAVERMTGPTKAGRKTK